MSRPNVLLVVLDSARADRFSCYGHSRQTTPKIDAIAADGVLFERCQAESSWTVPTGFTMLTGLAPREHRAEQTRRLPEQMPSLQEVLGRAGYRTILAAGNGFIGPVTDLDRGFDEVGTPGHVEELTKPFTKFLTRPMGWTDWWGAAITRRVIREIEQTSGPWFATVWYNECHHPFMGRQPFSTRFSDGRLSLARRFKLMSRMRHMKELAATADEQEWEDIRALYDGALGYNDHLVGELADGLRSLGAWDDTLVIVTADHGDLLGEHGLAGHRWAVGLYREVTHVPLIARIPGAGFAGERSDALVQLADITRTIAQMCGCAGDLATSAVENVDLRDAASGAGRQFAVSERAAIDQHSYEREKRKNPSFDYGPHMGAIALINDGEWEYAHRESAGDELFRTDDPDQSRNLIEERPDVAQRLHEQLAAWRKRVRSHASTSDVVVEEDEETRKRLEGLGYF